MPKAKQYRWVCDNPKHPGVLASSRPRRDDVRRFCWACSQEKGRLVERHCPALDKARAAKQERTKKAKNAQKERLRLHHLARVSYDGVNLEAELRRLWSLACVQDAVGALSKKSPCRPVPSLHVRHASKHPRRWGFAAMGRHHIHITLWPGAKIENVLGTLAHEVGHLLDYAKHGYRQDHTGRHIHHDDVYYDCRDQVALEAYGEDGWKRVDDRFVDACTARGVEVARAKSGVDMRALPKIGVHAMDKPARPSWSQTPGNGYVSVSGKTAEAMEYAFERLEVQIRRAPTGAVSAQQPISALRKIVRFTGRKTRRVQIWWTHETHKVVLWLLDRADGRGAPRKKIDELHAAVARSETAWMQENK